MFRDEFLPTFRVFVSSTFEDFKVERDALREHAFRELEAYCAERGCSFQAVDLRWGVDTEASIQQRTMRTCLGELRLCQSLSPRPNFLVLLGNRTGWQPLPEEIPGDEMEQVLAHVSPVWRGRLLSGDGQGGLYRLDENSLAPGGLYELQPRAGVYAGDRARWTEDIEQPLRLALLDAAIAAGLPDASLARYRASATEQEILAGAFAPTGADEHVVFFERVVTGAGPAPNETLKARLRQRLGARARRYVLPAAPASPGEPAMLALSDAVKADLRAIIDAELERRGLTDRGSVAAGIWRREVERGQAVLPGREDECARIVERCLASEGTVQVVEGAPGIGKSACVARCAALVAEQAGNALVVGCVCGTRPELFDCSGVFGLLLEQALSAMETPSQLAETRGLRAALRLLDALKLPARTRPVYVFLDALDVLDTDPAAAHLPQVLLEFARQRIRVIVGIRSGDAARRLSSVAGPQNVTRLGPLERETARSLLAGWLAEKQRRLTTGQTDALMLGYAEAGSPFWLRLAADVACAWPHDRPPAPLPGSVAGLLQHQIAILSAELGHGPLLVDRTIEALASARHGIPEPDLVAFLSDDEQVMAEFHDRHPDSPPSGTLPPIVWTRLRRDLQPLLAHRFMWSSLVLHLAHSQVRDALRTDLGRSGRLRDCQAKLADWLTRHRSAAPWAMAERDGLLAELGRDDELASALTDIFHLERRCRAGQVHDVVRALGSLAGRHPAAGEWHGRLSRHAGDLASGDLSLLTIAGIEAPHGLAALRSGGGTAPAHYLDVRPVWSAQSRAEGPVLEYEQTIGVDGPVFVFATTVRPVAFFRYLGHGIIERTSFDQAGTSSIAIEKGPPASLAAAGDGAHLGLVWRDGSGSIVAADQERSPAPTIHRFTVRRPEAESPALRWHGDRLFWQGDEGGLHWFDRTAAAEHVLPLPPGWETAEVADVAEQAGQVAALLRLPGSCGICRWADGGAGAVLARFDHDHPVAFAAAGDWAWAIALASHRVLVIDAAGRTTAETNVDLLPITFAVEGRRLLWISDGGHLFAWSPGGAPEEVLPRTEIIDIAALGDGRFALQRHTEVQVVRIARRERPLATLARLYLFPQPGAEGAYCALRTCTDEHGRVVGLDYVEASSRFVLPAFRFPSARIVTASSGYAIACLNEGGRGFVYEIRAHGAMPISGIPELALPAAMAGIEALDPVFNEPAPAFIVSCLDGGLYWLQADGRARPIGKLTYEGMSRAGLVSRGTCIVWHGTYLHRGEEGMADTYGVCVFEVLPAERRLTAKGARHFTLADGKLNAVAIDDVTGDLVLFWGGHATLDSYVMRAQPGDLLAGREARRPLPFNARDAAGAQALPGTRCCVLEEPGGKALLIDLESLRILAALPSGAAAQALAPVGGGAFLFADQGGGIYLATSRSPETAP